MNGNGRGMSAVRMFHSWFGWIEYIWQFALLIIMWLIIIRVIECSQILLLILLAIGVVYNFVFWVANEFWKLPAAKRQSSPDKRAKAWLTYYNDYHHSVLALLFHLIILIFLAIFVGTRDLSDPENKAVLRVFAVAILGMVGIICFTFFNPTYTIFYRNWTGEFQTANNIPTMGNKKKQSVGHSVTAKDLF